MIRVYSICVPKRKTKTQKALDERLFLHETVTRNRGPYMSRAVISYFFIFSTRVVRRMPSISAARATTPSCISSA